MVFYVYRSELTTKVDVFYQVFYNLCTLYKKSSDQKTKAQGLEMKTGNFRNRYEVIYKVDKE